MVDAIDGAFDGLRGNVVFCSWTGANAMSPQRSECLLSIYSEVGCPVLFLTPRNIPLWQVPEQPFHPAYEFLSATQKADYLRCYLMHHFGGGHTDIKRTRRPWNEHFAALRRTPRCFGAGYTEIGPHGVAPVGGALEAEMRANHQSLIGNCAFIFRRKSEFTYEWFGRTTRMLDEHLPLLREHPAQHPQDHAGVTLPDCSLSAYPLAWTAFCNIFHTLAYELHDHLLHLDLAPDFAGYR
jgi:hypothetical protein